MLEPPKTKLTYSETSLGKDGYIRGQSAGKDNVMATEADKAWLAGVIDGEGSISLFHNQEANGADKIKPVINFVNTDLGLVNEAIKILNDCGCNPYIVKRHQSKKNPKHKDVVEVKCTSIPQVRLFLEIVTPYLKSEKRHKAEILLRYVNRRIDKFSKNDRTYNEDDWNDVKEIRSSQTTREEPRTDSSVWL